MKRILFVIESLFALGPAQSLLQLSRELAERSVAVQIAVLQPVTITESVVEPNRLSATGSQPLPVEIFSLSASTISGGNWHRSKADALFSRSNCQSIWRLQKRISDFRPDVVHAWCGNAAGLTLVAAQLSRSRSLTQPRLFCTELFLRPARRLTRQLYEDRWSPGFCTMIVPHEMMRQRWLENGFQGDIQVVPNRISTSPRMLTAEERLSRRERLRSQLNLPANAKIAATVAPLEPPTRLKDLIWATDLLSCIRDDFSLIVFGNGSQADRLRRFAKVAGCSQRIHLLGEPTTAEPWLAGADCYWHSHLREPLPVNVLTAMRWAIPVVAVYGPGTQEIIRHQETGLAVNYGARDEFARWTKYLIERKDAAQQLATQGQSFVNQQFGGDALAERYLSIWNV